MKYQHQFILDKQYYLQVYEQTAMPTVGWKAYRKAIILFAVGLIASSLATTSKFIHLSYFVIGLGVIDALSVRFAKTWWLWRQQMSRAANNPVDVSIDEQGIEIKSAYLEQSIAWQDISAYQETSLGFIFVKGDVRHYLSKNNLGRDVLSFIQQQCEQLTP